MEFINSPGAGHEPVPLFAQDCAAWQFGCGCNGQCRGHHYDHILGKRKMPVWAIPAILAAAYAVPTAVVLWWLS